MLTNLENTAVAPGLDKVSFLLKPKDRQYQKMFIPYNSTHFTC